MNTIKVESDAVQGIKNEDDADPCKKCPVCLKVFLGPLRFQRHVLSNECKPVHDYIDVKPFIPINTDGPSGLSSNPVDLISSDSDDDDLHVKPFIPQINDGACGFSLANPVDLISDSDNEDKNDESMFTRECVIEDIGTIHGDESDCRENISVVDDIEFLNSKEKTVSKVLSDGEGEIDDDEQYSDISLPSSRKKKKRTYPALDITIVTSTPLNADSPGKISKSFPISPVSTLHETVGKQPSLAKSKSSEISQIEVEGKNSHTICKKDLMMWNGFLNSVFNISTGLRENQAAVIQAFHQGKDCLHILRTSGGKSITFQLPSVIEPDKMVLVISPISALIREQVLKLQQLGINAALLGNDTDGNVEEMDEVQILYLNPECIFNGKEPTKNMIRLMQRHESNIKRISLIAVDEAHKVFEWKSFRPAYEALLDIKEHFPSVPLHMHTATMTKKMQQISRTQVLRNPVVLKFSTNRPNIYYRVLSYTPPLLTTSPDGTVAENWRNAAKTIVRETNDKCALVYTSTAKSATALTTALLELNKVAAYYKGRSHQTVADRETAQDNHLNGNLQYLVATCAYGVGIENPNEENVLTVGMPATCIEYIQQSGRVGRRGQDSVSTLLVAQYKDIQKLQFWESEIKIRHSKDKNKEQLKDDVAEMHKEFKKVLRLACLPFAGLCLRAYIMKELDDPSDASSTHSLGCCDGCNISQFCKAMPNQDTDCVLNMLLACEEMKKIGIFSITQNKICAYLKGDTDKVAKKNDFVKKNLSEQMATLKVFGQEKQGMSVNMMTIIFKQCVAKAWFDSSFYTYRVDHNRGSVPTTVHTVNLSQKGKEVIETKMVDVPHPKYIQQAMEHVRNKEDEFYGVLENNENRVPNKGKGKKTYKQPQRQIERMLKEPYIPIISRDQYIYLGFEHDCSKLLFVSDVMQAPGYPGNGNLDFMWKDVTMSKKSSIPTVTKSVTVLEENVVVEATLAFQKNPCGGVKKCSRCPFVCSRRVQINPCPKHGEVADLVETDEECPGFFAYIKPVDSDDNRRWLGFLNGPHNHKCPPISKPTALLESQVQMALSRDPSLRTSDLQKGHGLDCMPMAISLAAANPTTMTSLRRKCMKNGSLEQTTSSAMIAHFDVYVKREIDCSYIGLPI